MDHKFSLSSGSHRGEEFKRKVLTISSSFLPNTKRTDAYPYFQTIFSSGQPTGDVLLSRAGYHTLARKLRERSRKYLAKNSKNAQDEENVPQPRPAGDEELQGRGAGLARGQPLTQVQRGARGGTGFPCPAQRGDGPGADSCPEARVAGGAARPGRRRLPAEAGALREPGPSAPRSARAAAAAGPGRRRAQPQPRPEGPGSRVPALGADLPVRPRAGRSGAAGCLRTSEYAGLAGQVGVSLPAEKAARNLRCTQSSVVRRMTEGIRPLRSGETPSGALH